jgi:hypothetical protein
MKILLNNLRMKRVSICLRLLHFIKFSLASQMICQIPPTLTTQLRRKNEVSPNFIVFIKEQNRCFINSNFELTHEIAKKLPTYAIHYKKNHSNFFPSFGGTSARPHPVCGKGDTTSRASCWGCTYAYYRCHYIASCCACPPPCAQL